MNRDTYVYSTLTNDTLYGPWVSGGADVPSKPSRVLIYGGANRADRDNRLFTPLGVATKVTALELETCKADPVFAKHVRKGFIVVDEKEVDPDHVAADMEGRSKDAPITPNDIQAENKAKPVDKHIETTTNVPAAPVRKSGARKTRKR